MKRTLPVCALLFALPLTASGQTTSTTIVLKVQAAEAPVPSLRYQLLPELAEIYPGNAIQAYLSCFSEQNIFFHSKEALDDRGKWATMPLHKLPLEQVRNYGGIALRRADDAARLERADWQVLMQLKKHSIELLIPEVQQMRELARALQVRFRGEVADGRFDAALRSAKTMFALARHVGEHPTLIGGLVAQAIASQAVEPLQEMIAQPGCPSLFWALSYLPRPLIDVRPGVQAERMALSTEFAVLDEHEAMSQAKLHQAINDLQRLFGLVGKEVDLGTWIAKTSKDDRSVEAARQRLVGRGLAAKAVQKFPAAQILLLDGKLHFEVLRDEALRAMTLPYPQLQTILDAARDVEEKDDSPFALFVPSRIVQAVRGAQGRVDQRLGLLQCVEALRLYAAKHDGNLPAKLADVDLPLPVDPFTGQPFHYEVAGNTAIIRGTPPRGQEKNPGYNIRYEVTIVK